MRLIESVRHGERVEDEDVSYVEGRSFFTQIEFDAPWRHRCRPEDAARSDSWIVRMRAQRARCQKAVESYERERSHMDSSMGGDELSRHEPHVGVELIRRTSAGRGV